MAKKEKEVTLFNNTARFRWGLRSGSMEGIYSQPRRQLNGPEQTQAFWKFSSPGLDTAPSLPLAALFQFSDLDDKSSRISSTCYPTYLTLLTPGSSQV